MPAVMTPMAQTTIVPAANAGFRATFDDMSLFIETFVFGVIDGWGFVRVVPLGGKDKPMPPQPVMSLLARSIPSLRRRIRDCERAVREERFARGVDEWFQTARPRLVAKRERLLAVDLRSLDDAGLAAHADAALALLYDALEVHLRLHGTNAMVLGELVFACRDLLGWDETRALELCSGLSTASTAPGAALAGLAQLARERPAVRALVERDEPPTAASLEEAGPEFAAAFARYQEEFGHRTIRYDVVDFTLAERPDLTLRLVRDQLARPFDAPQEAQRLAALREERMQEAREALAARPESERARLERAVERARRFYPIREERGFHTINGPLAVMRYTMLEAAVRLHERGDLARREDVFLLEFAEATAALRGAPVDAATVEARRRELARQSATEPPLSYGRDPGPPPSFAFLPPLARFANEAMAWVLDRNFAPDTSRLRQPAGPTVDGFAASRGTYEGPARLVRSEADFHRVQPGDVLLCPVTAPPWSVLFPAIGALVTDTGGILSHPAIIAREFGLPAVVGTGNATSLIADGRRVRVDGTAGRVELV